MKIRMGFVSNSSSTGYVIVNLTKEWKTLEDFVRENPEIVEGFVRCYGTSLKGRSPHTQEQMIKNAKSRGDSFPPRKETHISFGDCQGDVLGEVFDYMLRSGGTSKSFSWRFDHWER